MSLQFWTASSIAALPWVTHGFTHRAGGNSRPPFDSLNLGLHVGDAAEAVCANRSRVAEALGMDLGRMVCAEQVHGGKAAVVSSADAGRGASVLSGAMPGVDALLTDDPTVLLALFFADCVPVFFAGGKRRGVAVAHAGWRGLVAGVLENTLAAMSAEFGIHPGDVRAAVGPCIGSEHFEVGEEVAAHFPANTVLAAESGGKPHVDLATAALTRLVTAGLLPENISVAGECTVAGRDRYFSHRRDGGRTGRMGGFIAIR